MERGRLGRAGPDAEAGACALRGRGGGCEAAQNGQFGDVSSVGAQE